MSLILKLAPDYSIEAPLAKWRRLRTANQEAAASQAAQCAGLYRQHPAEAYRWMREPQAGAITATLPERRRTLFSLGSATSTTDHSSSAATVERKP
ncbi:MAG: hypothetical protein KGL92_00915 [Gammaproteobacteria bacterium]|nr:hypothetical protein [Gammaproteobacteria bacterium]